MQNPTPTATQAGTAVLSEPKQVIDLIGGGQLIRTDDISAEEWAALTAAHSSGAPEYLRVLGKMVVGTRRALDGVTVQKREANERLEQVRNQNTILARRLRTVGEMLRDEAIVRDWCDEYDTFVDRVNEKCGADVLDHMERDFDVTVTVTVSLTARNSDAASELVSEAIESAVDNFEYSASFDVYDVSES